MPTDPHPVLLDSATGTPLLRRVSLDGADSLWQVLAGGRERYRGCRVVWLAAQSVRVDVYKVL